MLGESCSENVRGGGGVLALFSHDMVILILCRGEEIDGSFVVMDPELCAEMPGSPEMVIHKDDDS